MEAIGANKVYFQGFKICMSTNGCIKLSFELECLTKNNELWSFDFSEE